jgi:sporulation protein YlmC with PRC-barrel domain
MKFGKSFCFALSVLSLFNTAASENATWKPDDACLGVLKRASLLLENRVGDKKERTLGKVHDLLLDLSSSQVMITLVSGGAAGQLTPVPARCYKYVSGARLVIDVEKSEFKGAPQIPASEPFKSLDPASLRDSFFYFNQNPPQLPAGGRFCSTANLIDTPVVNQAEEPLGKVRDVMIDVPTAQVVYLILEPQHGAGEAEELYVLPPVSVQFDKGGARLVVKGERAHFMAGPHFSSAFWSDLAFPELARKTRQHYGLDKGLAQSTPTEKTSVADDYQITRAILAEITHSAEGLLNTTIRITTVHGRVTLSGTLKDENQKKQIVTAAKRVAGAANVEEHLETNDKARTAKVGVVGDL